MRVVLASPAEIQRLEASVNATAVEINGRVQHVEFHNALLVPLIPNPTPSLASSSSAAAELTGNGGGCQGVQAGLILAPPGLI